MRTNRSSSVTSTGCSYAVWVDRKAHRDGEAAVTRAGAARCSTQESACFPRSRVRLGYETVGSHVGVNGQNARQVIVTNAIARRIRIDIES